MKRILTIIIITVIASTTALADNIEYTLRIGYSMGGTAPLGMPREIRKINSISLRPNFDVELDVHRNIVDRWGFSTGLRVERKAITTDVRTKAYKMELTMDGNKLEGRYTGNVVIRAKQIGITIPLLATYSINQKWQLKLGPYISMLTGKTFNGYVYDGYLREGDPTGQKVEMGGKHGNHATFDFSDNMRRMQYGMQAGADWQWGKHWGAYADIQWGINGVHHSNFHTIEQTLYPIYGTLGVMYKIK